MILLLALAASATDPLSACSAAMRQLGSAPRDVIEAACPAPPKRNIWSAENYDDRCDDVFTFARDAARTARGLPPVMLKGLVAEFDKRVAACQTPIPPKPLPPKDCATTKRLWC